MNESVFSFKDYAFDVVSKNYDKPNVMQISPRRVVYNL